MVESRRASVTLPSRSPDLESLQHGPRPTSPRGVTPPRNAASSSTADAASPQPSDLRLAPVPRCRPTRTPLRPVQRRHTVRLATPPQPPPNRNRIHAAVPSLAAAPPQPPSMTPPGCPLLVASSVANSVASSPQPPPNRNRIHYPCRRTQSRRHATSATIDATATAARCPLPVLLQVQLPVQFTVVPCMPCLYRCIALAVHTFTCISLCTPL